MARRVLTENRLQGLLVPVPDDVHVSVVGARRSPLPLLRARSTGPIPRSSRDVSLRDVPHSTRAETRSAVILAVLLVSSGTRSRQRILALLLPHFLSRASSRDLRTTSD